MLSGAQGYTMGVCGVFNWGLRGRFDPAWTGTMRGSSDPSSR